MKKYIGTLHGIITFSMLLSVMVLKHCLGGYSHLQEHYPSNGQFTAFLLADLTQH